MTTSSSDKIYIFGKTYEAVSDAIDRFYEIVYELSEGEFDTSEELRPNEKERKYDDFHGVVITVSRDIRVSILLTGATAKFASTYKDYGIEHYFAETGNDECAYVLGCEPQWIRQGEGNGMDFAAAAQEVL